MTLPRIPRAGIRPGLPMDVWLVEGAPTNGTNGTYAGVAPKGQPLSDVTNGNLYINQGTKASPVWVLINIPTIQTVINNAGVPVDGTTGANVANPGQILVDTTNKKAYINGGTLASPVWKQITSAA